MLKLFIFTLLSWLPLAQANIAEKQEVRLAKAQIALASGDEKSALTLIEENLDPRHFHGASYQFLAEYYLKKKKVSKAFRVYYSMISTLHDKRVLLARFDDRFLEYIATLGRPSQEALEIYFHIAELYYELSENDRYSRAFQARLLQMSEKYFSVTQFYRYEQAFSKVYIGRILARRDNNHLALENFVEAKELLSKELDLTDEESLPDLDLLIGSTLIKRGLIDSGSFFLKKAYLSGESNASTQAIASEYLNIINVRFFSLTARLDLGFSDNVYELNDLQESRYDQVESILGPIDGRFLQYNLTAYYNHPKLFTDYDFLFSSSINQKSFSHELHRNRNDRSFTFGAEAKSFTKDNSIIKLRTYQTLSYVPESNEGDYSKSSQSTYLEAQYLKLLKSGTLTYSLPINLVDYTSGSEDKTYGVSISYLPLSLSRYFSPSFGLLASRRLEAGTEEYGSRFELNTSVQIDWNTKWASLGSAVYRLNNNDVPRLDYAEMEFNFNSSYSLKHGFALNIDLNHIRRKASNDRSTVVLNLIGGVSFTY